LCFRLKVCRAHTSPRYLPFQTPCLAMHAWWRNTIPSKYHGWLCMHGGTIPSLPNTVAGYSCMVAYHAMHSSECLRARLLGLRSAWHVLLPRSSCCRCVPRVLPLRSTYYPAALYVLLLRSTWYPAALHVVSRCAPRGILQRLVVYNAQCLGFASWLPRACTISIAMTTMLTSHYCVSITFCT
jgi:hypothetical protein